VAGASAVFQWLREFVFLAIPPFRTRLAAQIASSDAAYTIVVNTRADQLVAFDMTRKTVARLGAAANVDERVLDLRKKLSSVLDLPKVTNFRPGEILEEDFAEGLPLRSLTTAERLRIVRTLVGQFESLVERHTQSESEAGFWREAVAAFRDLELPSSMRSAFDTLPADIDRQFEELGFCVAHGDLSASNILVTSSGATLIDLEDCAVLPVFFDLFFLAHQEAICGRDDILEYVVLGEGYARIARTLDKRCSASGQAQWAMWVWASLIAECFAWTGKSGSPALSATRLQTWWSPLRRVLPASKVDTRSNGDSCLVS
jgi:hypothetical protein